MRLQLTTAVALATTATTARAEPTIEGDRATVVVRTAAYVDDDRTAISTTAVAARVKPTSHVVLSTRLVADAVSSASVDVITAATGRWSEVRAEALGGVAFADGTTTLSLDYTRSHEDDWNSHTIAAGASRDVLQHNLTLGIGGSYVTNDVGRAEDRSFSRHLRVIGGALRAVWTSSPTDLFSVAYDASRANGYQASPYRYAFVADPADPAGVPLAFPETAPELRTRHAVTGRWNRHVGDDSVVRSHLRVYGDDWGVRSVTTGSEVAIGLEPYEVAVHARLYAQQHASFYQDVYDRPRRYMIADRELSTFQDVFVGVRGRWIGETVMLDADLTGFAFRFPEFSRLPRRLGFTAALGLVWAILMRAALVTATLALVSLAACQPNLEAAFEPAALDRPFYDCKVQPVLTKLCGQQACHGNADRYFQVYARNRLRADGDEAQRNAFMTPSERAHNYEATRAFVDVARPDRSLLLRKPLEQAAGGAFHVGAELFGDQDVFPDTDDADYQVLAQWIEGAVELPTCQEPGSNL